MGDRDKGGDGIGMGERAAQPIGPGCSVARLCRYEVVREIVLGLEDADRRPRDLRHDRELARSTLYNHVDRLFELGIVVRRDPSDLSSAVVYEHGENGPEFHDLLRGWGAVLRALRRRSGKIDWVAPLHFGEAWGAGVVQALLDGPRSSGQVIAACTGRATRAQVERLLGQMRRHGYVKRSGRRHILLGAGRQAIGELAASARFERRHGVEGAVPITAVDGADALRATLPVVELPGSADGTCEFVVLGDEDVPGRGAAACWIELRGGKVVAAGAGNATSATAWAQGSIDDWLGAVLEHRGALIKSAGEPDLGRGVVRELNAEIYRNRP
jgi:DNA-binding HxlR family transcriptional regulator